MVGAPAGGFHLDRSSNHPTVLISAGIGATPLIAMLKAYAELGDAAPPLQWIHVARNSAAYVHRAEVDEILAGRTNLRRHVHFTSPLPGDRIGIDYEGEGRLSFEELRRVIEVYRYPIFGRQVELPGAASEFYVCGPPEFEADVRSMLGALGASARSIRTESFGIAAAADGADARIRFARAGVDIAWVPGETLLECAEAAGLAVEHECRAGACHRCQTTVLEGDVVYPREPAVLPPVGTALLCCSRPAGRSLMLDL